MAERGARDPRAEGDGRAAADGTDGTDGADCADGTDGADRADGAVGAAERRPAAPVPAVRVEPDRLSDRLAEELAAGTLPARAGRGPRLPLGRSCGVLASLGCLLLVVALGLLVRAFGDDLARLLVRARREEARAEMLAIVRAADAFRRERGAFPATLAELVELGRLDAEAIVDPWGHAYVWEPTTGELRSLGRDGVPGGAGADADVEP